MLRKIIASFTLIIITHIVFAQNEPCKSYFMKGYSGNCSISIAISPDSKYLYSSDLNSLKKWDMATSTVVEEIQPFPYMLVGSSPDPRFLLVYVKPNEKKYKQQHLYDLKLKSISPDPEIALRRLVSPDNIKPFEKASKAYGSNIFFSPDSSTAVIVSGDAYTSQLNVATGKMSSICSGDHNPIYISEINTVVTNIDNKYQLVNLGTGKRTSFKSPTGFDIADVTPDKKYIVASGYGTFFIDRNSGALAFHTNDRSVRAKFKSDGSAFFTFDITEKNWDEFQLWKITKYSYPDFKKVKEIEQKYTYRGKDGIRFNPDTELMYDRRGSFDPETATVKVPFDDDYKLTEADVQAKANEKDRNTKNGNNALAKLSDLKVPPIAHSINGLITTYISDYTDDGMVMIYDQYFTGGAAILWSFPEGKPVAAYRDEHSSAKGAAPESLLVPGKILWAFVSPSGKTVGLNTSEGSLLYEGKVLKAKLDNKKIVALAEGKALVGTLPEKEGNPFKDLALVSTEDGRVLNKIKSKPFYPGAQADVKSLPGKILFAGNDDVAILDLANPSEIIYYSNTQIPPSSVARYILEGRSVKDRITGKEDIIAGMGPLNLSKADKSVVRANYLINYYWQQGFFVYDANTKKLLNDKAVFPGWEKFDRVVYFKNLNKIFAMSELPIYTAPNASKEDQGASAFTVDITTGEITPYLLTEGREKFLTMVAEAEKAAFAYAALSPCEKMARQFGRGENLHSSKGAPFSIVLGYDCEKEAYVVAQRQLLHPGSNSTVQISRLFAVTQKEIYDLDYRAMGSTWELCPKCKGYPVEFETRTTSGWSDWEQKSLNIYVYSRKWETKTDQIQVVCTRCKGEAWVKH